MSELAFSFGRIAAEYDDVRPEYAPEALDRAAEVLGLTADSRVVDLAAGSGKLTRPLAARFAEVVAVEPNEEMRAVLAGRSAGIKVLAGTAERMPLPDDFADAVFVGDAFHWFDGPAAVAELERVLRPQRRCGAALEPLVERRRRREDEHARSADPGRGAGHVRQGLLQLGPGGGAGRDGRSAGGVRRRRVHAARAGGVLTLHAAVGQRRS